jgi:hypothetical protein
MNCVKCGKKTEIINTHKYETVVWRRRRCEDNHRFNTHESFVEDTKKSKTTKPLEAMAPVQPLLVRNPRKQIEDIKEYLEYRRKAGEE